jgi:hypothetical protein
VAQECTGYVGIGLLFGHVTATPSMKLSWIILSQFRINFLSLKKAGFHLLYKLALPQIGQIFFCAVPKRFKKASDRPPCVEGVRLEEASIGHLEFFLLELGGDFCFFGKQRHLRIGDEWYRVDLVFPHLTLAAIIVRAVEGQVK